MMNKSTCLSLLFCAFFTHFLSAQNPLYTTKLFSPLDTSVLNFSLNQLEFEPKMLPDSGFIAFGNVGPQHLFSRFDKYGNLLSLKTFRNDSLVLARSFAVTSDGSLLMLGTYRPQIGSTSQRLFLAKFDVNGVFQWSRVYSVPEPSGSTGTVIHNMIAVNSLGSIMIAGTNTTTNNTTWLSFFMLTNSNGISQKSWTYNENGRPTICVTQDDGFLLSVAKTQAGRYDIAANLRLVWLNKNGDFLRSLYLGPLNASSLGSFTPRVLPLPDGSIVLAHAFFVSRLAQDGTIIWSRGRSHSATTGVTFRVGSSLSVNSLMISSKNKIYVPSGLFESSPGLGKEIPVINEYDFDGNMRSWAYPNANSRISSMTEIGNNKGFFITADTIIARGAGITKNIAFRLMRADTLFNAGCGAPILLNSNMFNGDNIQVVDPPVVLTSTPFATADYSPTTVTTAQNAPIITKGECPNSIVRTNEQALPNVNIYPNPSSGDFTIESEDAAIKSVQVFDIAGRFVQKIQNNSARIALNIEQSGTYFLHIQTTNARLVKKIVKLN
jgi:hypothetical protein